MPNRDLKVTLLGEDKTSGAFRSAAKESEGFGSKVKDTGKELSLAFGAAALGGIFGIGEAMVEGAKGAADYQKVGDQVAQTIKSTGNAAHVTVDGLKSYAEEAEKMSGVDKQLILNGENVMLTFTNVKNAAGEGNDIFTRASESALNLSTTMGIDLVSANRLVGKALNDPIKGLSSLSRVGVQFNDQQKKQIEAMVKSHDVMGAQKIILDQLKVKFGGAAEAAGKGLTGSLERSKHAFETMMQHIMGAVMPGIAKLAEFIAGTLIPDIEKMAAWIGKNREPITIIAGLITAVFIPKLIAMGVQSLIAAGRTVIGWATQSAAAVTASVRIVASVVQVVAGWVLMGVQSLIQAARVAAAWVIAMGPVGWVIAIVVALVALIITHWQLVVQWTKDAWHWVTQAVGAAWEWIKSAVAAALRFLVNLFLNFTGPGLIIKHWSAIVAFTKAAWAAVTAAIGAAWNWITSRISSAVSAVRGAISSAWNWVSSTTSNAWHGLVSIIGNAITSAVSFVGSLPGRILSALGNLGSLLWNAGKSMIQGLIDGAGSLLRNIGSFFLNLLPGWIVGPFKFALGIHSPSKVFAGFGQNIGHGLIQGMNSMQPAVAAQMQALANTQGLAGLGVNGPRISTPSAMLGGLPGSTLGRSSVPAVHIQNYNEAKQSPREIAESLAFMARTR